MRIADGKLKKILVAVIIFVLTVLMVACNYNPATDDVTGSGNAGNTGVDQGSSGSGSPDDAYTVTLSVTLPKAYLVDVKAIWTDVESGNGAYYSANFDKNGVATVTGLDGDYRVTLSKIPEGYTYNPNIYYVNSESKDKNVEIKLFKLCEVNNPTATGLTGIDSFKISTTGAYRAVLTKDNYENGLWFSFIPTYAGNYSLESMIDVTANKLNPLLDQHAANAGGYVNYDDPDEEVRGGGEENTYTKNFRWEAQIAGEKIGNRYCFHIYATTLDKNVFPIYVDFLLERDGEFSGGSSSVETEEVESTHDFDALASIAFNDLNAAYAKYDPSESASEKDKPYTYYGYYGSYSGLLDDSNILYDADLDYYYVMENGVRKMLYATISRDNLVIDTSENESASPVGSGGFMHPLNKPRTIKGTDDEGNVKYYNYVSFIEKYASYAEDGYYPVTAELKLFLQRYSTSSMLFKDGQGIAEYDMDGNLIFMSSEKNQWLFACLVFK